LGKKQQELEEEKRINRGLADARYTERKLEEIREKTSINKEDERKNREENKGAEKPKEKLCYRYLKGECRHEDKCHYVHKQICQSTINKEACTTKDCKKSHDANYICRNKVDIATLPKIMRNCVQMEIEKKWEFSIEKSNWMVMKTGKRSEEIEDIKVEVKQGEIKRAKVYKYLGNWANEEANMDTQLEMMEKRIGEIVRSTDLIAGKEAVGNMEVTVKLFLYQRTIIQTMYYNIEAWSNMRKIDEERLEVIQGKLLKKLLKLPKSTPYWGILIESGMWPIKWQIVYEKLMLLHNLFHSDDERTAKQVIKGQQRNHEKECWYSEAKDALCYLAIDKHPEDAIKSEWKRITKEKINKKVQEEAEVKRREMKKLRFIGQHGRKEYVNAMNADEVREVMKI
jgi:hypothetical protein